MGRNENIAVFKDTENLVNSNEKLKKSLQESINHQKLILENDDIVILNLEKYTDDAQIIVSKKRTFEAASKYKGMKTVVHNFASATNPGGGVENGANAQEECLCRCSSLYFNLITQQMWDGFYKPHRNAHNPIHNDDIIFTPKVTVFKTDTANPKLMSEKDWYEVDIITCAAPNLRPHPGNRYNYSDGATQANISDKDLLKIHEKRLERILNVAVNEESEVVILGAFGCGAFMNNPEVVAQSAKNIITKYKKNFKVVEFAIYCRPNDEQNFKTFSRVLG